MNKRHIPIGDKYPEIVNVFTEMEKGAQSKYEYDEKSDAIKLDRVFHDGVINPTDYGFITQTIAEDKDNLDTLVISSSHIAAGSLIEVKVIGMLEISDTNGRDNKIISIHIKDSNLKNIEEIKDLDPNILQKILDFFKRYQELENNKLKIGEWKPKEEAIELVKKAHNAHLNTNQGS